MRLWREGPLGQHFKIGSSQPPLGATNVWGQAEWNTIVGIVSDVKPLHLRSEVLPEVYVPYWQWPMQNPTLLVRTRGDPGLLRAALEREAHAAIPAIPPPVVRTMADLLSDTVAQPRLQTGLLCLFAGVALLLAGVGIYGLLTYAVTQRVREIGIRLALGAQRRAVLALVLAQGMRLALIGVGTGVALAWALTRVMRTLLYEVRPTDLLTFTIVPLVLLAVASLACYFPARRATRIDPMEALRYE